ncbi:MAG: S1 RNA-binding domain-containing protein [Bacillota bacterium]|nr:S1 RNA-binding domain-containing protein [Bacillota bacterium]
MPLEVGKNVEGKVKSIAPFGAFVELSDGTTGLVHISEVDVSYVKDINERVKVGQDVIVKVLSIDEKGKVNLSMKKVMEEEHRKNSTRRNDTWTKPQIEPMNFEDMLSKFKKESDEKIQKLDLNKKLRRNGGRK